MLKRMVNGKEVVCTPEEEAALRAEWAANESAQRRTPLRRVEKLTILTRLDAAGKLAAARAAMDAAPLLTREKWNAMWDFDSADEEVRGFLSAIGADPDAILAP